MRTALLVFALALAVRALPLGTVFTEKGMMAGGLADEFYHLRRIQYSVAHFPDVLQFDPYSNFPDGGHIHWPPGFDWAVAAVARGLVGPDDPAGVERVAGWAPPVLGALAVAVAAGVGRAAFGPAGGATAGVVLALVPAHYVFSRLGTVDHHVAVALAAVVLLGTGMAWLRGDPRRPGLARSAGLGLAMGLPLLAWPGFLLHAGLTAAVAAVVTLASAGREEAAGRARGLAGAHAVAGAVVLPFCLGPAFEQFGAWSPLVLSRFQIAWFGGATAVLAMAAALWAHPAAGRGRGRRVAGAAVLGLLGLGVALALAPGLREAVLYASGWFARAEDFQTHVGELRPLDLGTAISRYSLLLFAFPVAWALVAERAVRERAADRALLLAWAAVFLVLALEQKRFNNSFSVPYALVWGGLVGQLLPGVRARLAGRPGRAVASAIGAGLVLLVAVQPVLAFYEPVVARNALFAPQDRPIAISPRKLAFIAAAEWLAQSTPPTAGYMDPQVQPEYGVLCPWGVGHLMRYRSQRPMVQDNFGVYGGKENFERAWAYYAATEEDEARRLLERLGVRYVVADRMGAGSTRPYGPGQMASRLALLYGSAGRVQDVASGRPVEVPALAHHRLVYHFRPDPGPELAAEPPRWAVGVWETVPGARVEGVAAPGERVQARLRLTTGQGRTHFYRTHTWADRQGRYRLTLPYPTDVPFSNTMRAGEAYVLRSSALREPLGVPEAAVRAGARLAGPRLAP